LQNRKNAYDHLNGAFHAQPDSAFRPNTPFPKITGQLIRVAVQFAISKLFRPADYSNFVRSLVYLPFKQMMHAKSGTPISVIIWIAQNLCVLGFVHHTPSIIIVSLRPMEVVDDVGVTFDPTTPAPDLAPSNYRNALIFCLLNFLCQRFARFDTR